MAMSEPRFDQLRVFHWTVVAILLAGLIGGLLIGWLQ